MPALYLIDLICEQAMVMPADSRQLQDLMSLQRRHSRLPILVLDLEARQLPPLLSLLDQIGRGHQR